MLFDIYPLFVSFSGNDILKYSRKEVFIAYSFAKVFFFVNNCTSQLGFAQRPRQGAVKQGGDIANRQSANGRLTKFWNPTVFARVKSRWLTQLCIYFSFRRRQRRRKRTSRNRNHHLTGNDGFT